MGEAAPATAIIPEDEAIQPKSCRWMAQSKASAESGRARVEETEGEEGGGAEEGAAAHGSGRHGRFHQREISRVSWKEESQGSWFLLIVAESPETTVSDRVSD